MPSGKKKRNYAGPVKGKPLDVIFSKCCLEQKYKKTLRILQVFYQMRPTTPRSSGGVSVSSTIANRAVTVYDSRGRAINLRLSMRELRAAARAAGISNIPIGDDQTDRESLERCEFLCTETGRFQ